MVDKYRIRWTKKLYFIVSLLIYGYLILITVNYLKDDLYTIFWLALGLFIILFFVITHVLLFLNYYNVDKDSELQLNREEGIIELIRNKEKIKFRYLDIEKIIVHQTYYASRGGKYVTPADYFSFSEIQIRDGRCIVVTSLLCDDLKLKLGDKEKTMIRKLPLIPKSQKKW